MQKWLFILQKFGISFFRGKKKRTRLFPLLKKGSLFTAQPFLKFWEGRAGLTKSKKLKKRSVAFLFFFLFLEGRALLLVKKFKKEGRQRSKALFLLGYNPLFFYFLLRVKNEVLAPVFLLGYNQVKIRKKGYASFF